MKGCIFSSKKKKGFKKDCFPKKSLSIPYLQEWHDFHIFLTFPTPFSSVYWRVLSWTWDRHPFKWSLLFFITRFIFLEVMIFVFFCSCLYNKYLGVVRGGAIQRDVGGTARPCTWPSVTGFLGPVQCSTCGSSRWIILMVIPHTGVCSICVLEVLIFYSSLGSSGSLWVGSIGSLERVL